MNEIKGEMDRLRKASQEYKVASLNKQEYRRIAEENAKRFAEQQETLNVYNTVLDLHLSKTRVEDIEAETVRMKKQNEDTLRELENMFGYKVKCEEEIQNLRKAIEAVRDDFLTLRIRSSMVSCFVPL